MRLLIEAKYWSNSGSDSISGEKRDGSGLCFKHVLVWVRQLWWSLELAASFQEDINIGMKWKENLLPGTVSTCSAYSTFRSKSYGWVRERVKRFWSHESTSKLQKSTGETASHSLDIFHGTKKTKGGKVLWLSTCLECGSTNVCTKIPI